MLRAFCYSRLKLVTIIALFTVLPLYFLSHCFTHSSSFQEHIYVDDALTALATPRLPISNSSISSFLLSSCVWSMKFSS